MQVYQVWTCPNCKERLRGNVIQAKTLVMCPKCKTRFIAKDG